MSDQDSISSQHAGRVVSFLDQYFGARAESDPIHGVPLPVGQAELLKAMRYSVLQEGGKRFRPVLSLLTAEALGHPAGRALAFGSAVECIHTYSLIHDDLPAMDNDDFRRGQPTSHKAFGEANAILAGDALLTESFEMIASHYANEPAIAIKLVSETAQAAGLFGMVGGQGIDMGAKKEQLSFDSLRQMHRLKTGALIRLSVRGAAILCGANSEALAQMTKFGESIGLAFQVADDLLDSTPEKPEPGSFPELIGYDATRAFLSELTEDCLKALEPWPAAEPLRAIARYNRDRLR